MLRNKWKTDPRASRVNFISFVAASLLRTCRHHPGASLVNSIRFPDPFLIILGWRMVLEFPCPIPTAFLGRSVFNMENGPSSLIQFHDFPLLNSQEKCMEIGFGALQATSNRLPYSILMKNHGKCSWGVPGPIPSDFFIEANK